MKKKVAPKINLNYLVFSIAIVVFILVEILFYQFYHYVPIKLNGKDLKAVRGETVENFLTRIKKMPKYGRLIDVEGKAIADAKGEPPKIWVNNKFANPSYSVKNEDKIATQNGKDTKEEIKTALETVQSKIVYKGKGAFIYVIKRGRPGLKMVEKGQVSKKVVSDKWKLKPVDFTIGRINIRYRKVVALTFDDGPSKYTGQILKILKQYKAKASFFVVGRLVEKRAKLLKLMAGRGYTIGNHTYNHIPLNKNVPKKIKNELQKTKREIKKAAGIETKWVRPPWGLLNSSAINFVLKEKYHISLWNIDTSDWKRKSPRKIKEKVLNNLKSGQVILLHDGGGNRGNTVQALPQIIKGIKEAGYRLVSLEDMYRLVE